jgi:transcriptional regulator with XRE-family HTH domain
MSTNIDKIAFGDRLKQLMAARGFNQSKLARRSGVERTVINRMINGKAKPKHEYVEWMARALEVDTLELLLHTDLSDELRRIADKLLEALGRIDELEREREAALCRARQLEGEVRRLRLAGGSRA